MFITFMDSNLTICGMGKTESLSFDDAVENCFHSHHPVILEIDTCSTLEVDNFKDLKEPLDSDDLLNLEVIPFEDNGVEKCRLVAYDETH